VSNARNVSKSRWIQAFSCAAALLSWRGQALAAAADLVDLSWNAVGECSSAAQVLRAVQAQLGPDFTSDTRLVAHGELSLESNGAYLLRLSYTTNSGSRDERQMRGESCAAVSDAAALALALALNPSVGIQAAVEAPASTAKADEKLASFVVQLLAAFDTPVLGLPTLGGGLRAGVALAGLELSISAQLFLPREQTSHDITIELQYWSLDVGACYLVPAGSWSLGPCARFELGRLSGDPRGDIDEPTQRAARVHAVTLGGVVRLRLYAPLWFALDASLEWVARRPQFNVTGTGTIARPNTFGARLSLGPMLAF
jgi:hypothetical protein